VNVEIGRGWHKLSFSTHRSRWPTLNGENPPRGIPYRCVEVSYGSRCVQVRLWDWRRQADTQEGQT
jgi:hypothetical protein